MELLQMNAYRFSLIFLAMFFVVTSPGCRKGDVPKVVSFWAEYDFTDQELRDLEVAARSEEDAARKLAMYYTGIKRDKEKREFWERRMLLLHKGEEKLQE
jgi:hypothetical protein